MHFFIHKLHAVKRLFVITTYGDIRRYNITVSGLIRFDTKKKIKKKDGK
jgi:hypothetical protein